MKDDRVGGPAEVQAARRLGDETEQQRPEGDAGEEDPGTWLVGRDGPQHQPSLSGPASVSVRRSAV